jgi:hypothetical protein
VFDLYGILDFERAAKNVRTDIFGDWYSDPWLWPEHEWLMSDEGVKHVRDAIRNTEIRRGHPLEVPKENFSTRPAYVFDPVERLVYQALVDKVSVSLVGSMPTWSYSWRLSRNNPKAGNYADMGDEWKGYRNRLSTLSTFFDVALTSDIVSFFPSIPVDQLVNSLYDAAKCNAVTERLSTLLEGWDRISDRGGLPMRANASSILASMYLRPLDDALLHHGRSAAASSFLGRYRFSKGTAARWVDDIWLFGHDVEDMRMAQLDAQAVMRSLGLNMNLAKTDVLEGDDMMARARQLEHSAVDAALLEEIADYEPLDQLVERIIAKPESANHTSVRFVTVRMRKYSHYKHLDKLIELAPRMPHASAALSRMFLESGRSRELAGWYADFCKSPWAKMELAVANFAMMFPGTSVPELAVQSALEEKLLAGCSLPVLAIAGQRLARWQPDRARALFREIARKADHPLQRRVLALAALGANESRTWVTKLLSEFRENAVTLHYLRERSFAPPKDQAEFVGY